MNLIPLKIGKCTYKFKQGLLSYHSDRHIDGDSASDSDGDSDGDSDSD